MSPRNTTTTTTTAAATTNAAIANTSTYNIGTATSTAFTTYCHATDTVNADIAYRVHLYSQY